MVATIESTESILAEKLDAAANRASPKHPEAPDDNCRRERPRQSQRPSQPKLDKASSEVADKPTPAPVSVSPTQTFADLVRKASAGDLASLTELRRTLDGRPDIWQRVGDVSLLAERSWIDLACAGNSLLEESIRRQLVAMKSEIAGSNPSPVERVIIDLIGVTWLAAFHGESAASQPSDIAQQATIRLRRAESAQRRFLRAIKMLTTLRALVPRGTV